MRSPALWLTARELGARRRRVALAALVVAATAAAATAMELVARAREEAIAADIDAMGPALTIVPQGVTAAALARLDLGDRVLPPGAEAAARAALGRDLRAIERRLVVHRELSGVRVPVIGVEEDASRAASIGSSEAALGSELARRLGYPQRFGIGEDPRWVAGVLPSTGTADDTAVFVPIRELQALAAVEAVNELRLFLRAGVSPREAEARLARAPLGAAVIRSDRGEVADGEAQQSLSRHRGAAYAVLALVAGLCLLIAAHLDAAERRVELATLVAIGASRWTVLGALLSRSALVAVIGAIAGVIGGAALAVSQAPSVGSIVGGAQAVAAATVAAALALGVVASAPTALAAVARDPVRDLQDG